MAKCSWAVKGQWTTNVSVDIHHSAGWRTCRFIWCDLYSPIHILFSSAYQRTSAMTKSSCYKWPGCHPTTIISFQLVMEYNNVVMHIKSYLVVFGSQNWDRKILGKKWPMANRSTSKFGWYMELNQNKYSYQWLVEAEGSSEVYKTR